jgi:two-component system, LuxR family, response regulator FixJ
MQSASSPSTAAVIVVEDDPAVLSSLKFALEVEGFVVRTHDSAEALLGAGVPSGRACLVLDYQLPGMNGLELLRRLRESGRDLPAILITTPSAETTRRAALAGVSIVEKPLLCETLLDKVRSLTRPRPDRPS